MRILFSFLAFFSLALLGGGREARAVLIDEGFLHVKSDHFIVYYPSRYEAEAARRTADRAEYYYDRVSRDVGYTRYDNYWTWERRARIVLLADQISYSRLTGQPEWSLAYASRSSRFFQDRTIVTFSGQPNFFDEILPHEIAHLILWDYFDGVMPNVPVWLEEGIAQMQETSNKDLVNEGVRPLVATGRHIPFPVFCGLRPAEIQDPSLASVFYAQSLSVVVFLLEKYGQEAFYR
ncbi:MAG: hypothetical protein GX606_04125, partial [Elusimicrobia bacterium]|nr:hypothetical protein [Elusimicrobiota bacterium]